ncbi:universal stress protein [Tenacibaculum sp. HL-MS23]|uniref:universal stress protein n=1 Tax=Tenacibaculum TaxID=104267 RepID=UPI001C4E7BD3|nr:MULTISPECIES: universal stress protein [Tenacibaculum]QXP74395.1 universal stress protein [Tenacibaculum sp. AHE14PA]QXP75236.1 universal stress protein [Tenacibaculum sp. AHE15PA]WNW01774.1 universal stress protein [Tenacibaculum sp. HL-MS23]
MKKIIIPVDFSIHSENALQTAAFLAKENNAEIVVVHMLELSNSLINQSDESANQETFFYLKLAEKRFKEFLDKDYLSDIKVTPIIKHFKIFSELDELAKEENVDLIVMGSKGADGLKEMFIGSNTEKVIRHAHVPVMVIKEQPITKKIEKVVFACDFTNDDVSPYIEAKAFFNKLGAKLQLVYINTPTTKFKNTKELEEEMKVFFNKANESASSINEVKIISDYSVEKGILYFANASNADIVAVATHGRKGISHFFEGSISEDIANHSKLPIVSFKI